MRRKKIFAWLLAIVLVGSFFVVNSEARAEEIGIKISPIKFEELVVPGQVLHETIKVTNDSNVAKTFYPFLNDFVADGEYGQPKLVPPGSEATGLSSWINITSEGINFAPRQEREINFVVQVPENVGPGGYYGAVLFGTEPGKVKIEGADKGAAMATAQKTAALVLLQVAGEVDESASIREFSTSKGFYSTPFDVNFNVRIENTGNTHIKPVGTINIKNFWGKDVANVRMNESNSNILRSSFRRFSGEWKDNLGFGKYRAALGLSFGTAADQGGQGKQTLYAETNFWIIPWKIIVPTFLGLAILISLIVLFLKIYKDRAVKRAMEQIGARQKNYAKNISKKADEGNGLGLALIVVVILIILLVIYFSLFA